MGKSLLYNANGEFEGENILNRNSECPQVNEENSSKETEGIEEEKQPMIT